MNLILQIKLRSLLLLFLLVLPSTGLTEVKPLSERVFWTGPVEEPQNLPAHGIFLTKMKWMRSILWSDAALGRKTIVFFERSYRVEGDILTPRDGEFLLSQEDVESWAGSEFYDSYAIRRTNPNRINFLPKSGDNFHVSCHYVNTRESFLGCTLRQSYPPDDHIELRAEFTFSKFPQQGDPFKPIADRLLELAYCLDVTGDIESQETERKPLDCKIDVTS